MADETTWKGRLEAANPHPRDPRLVAMGYVKQVSGVIYHNGETFVNLAVELKELEALCELAELVYVTDGYPACFRPHATADAKAERWKPLCEYLRTRWLAAV